MLDVKTEKEIERKSNFKLKIYFHKKALQQPFFLESSKIKCVQSPESFPAGSAPWPLGKKRASAVKRNLPTIAIPSV